MRDVAHYIASMSMSNEIDMLCVMFFIQAEVIFLTLKEK